jgi:hypothetical protein
MRLVIRAIEYAALAVAVVFFVPPLLLIEWSSRALSGKSDPQWP